MDSPWLPQTVLVAVRHPGIDKDRPARVMEWAIPYVEQILSANPDLQIHHAHDPNQDRAAVETTTYFRLKYRRLSRAYRDFLARSLQPGAAIVVVECRSRWPAQRLGDRHYFQTGGEGGLTPMEYLDGGPRVEEFLQRMGSPYHDWNMPAPNARAPEAEWGFVTDLLDDLLPFAAEHGFQVWRLSFVEPEDPSPVIAELFRAWYREQGVPDTRLLVSSFILLAPLLSMRIGAAPYWAVFGTEPSLARLESYLEQAGQYEDILVLLYPHGVESASVAGPERWRSLERLSGRSLRLIGVNEKEFPHDLGSLFRYPRDLRELGAGARYSPGLMTLDDCVRLLRDIPGEYALERIHP
jgi:hypothetical protein